MILGFVEYESIKRFLSILTDCTGEDYRRKHGYRKHYAIRTNIWRIERNLGNGLLHRSEPTKRNLTLCQQLYYSPHNLTKKRKSVTCPYCNGILRTSAADRRLRRLTGSQQLW